MIDIRKRLHQAMLWERHRIRLSLLREEHALKYLFFEVSRQCNLNCLYCGSDCTPDVRTDELTTEEWLNIIAQLAADYPKRPMIAVTGGEPLLRDGIFEIFGALHKYGFPYGMVCNSTLLDADAAQKIVEVGMGSISLSMDAPPLVNDAIRGTGTSKAVEEAIQNLRNAGYKGILEILSTISKPAIQTLDEMHDYVRSLGIRRWRLAPVMPIGRAATHYNLVPDDDDMEVLLNFIMRMRQTDKEMRIEFGEEGYLGHTYEGRVRGFLCQCRAGINVGGIRYNGIIGACPELAATFDQGDIRKESFKSVWDTRFENLRDRSWTRNLGPCRTCDRYKDCRGGALHLYSDMKTEALRCLYMMCGKKAEK